MQILREELENDLRKLDTSIKEFQNAKRLETDLNRTNKDVCAIIRSYVSDRTSMFDKLKESSFQGNSGLYYSMEAFLLRNKKYWPLFSTELRVIARTRLRSVGYKVTSDL